MIRTFPRDSVAWAVLATDGAQKHVDRLGQPWSEIAARDAEQLAAFVEAAQHWEAHADPEGVELPRSKRHDDKTILTWRPIVSRIS